MAWISFSVICVYPAITKWSQAMRCVSLGTSCSINPNFSKDRNYSREFLLKKWIKKCNSESELWLFLCLRRAVNTKHISLSWGIWKDLLSPIWDSIWIPWLRCTKERYQEFLFLKYMHLDLVYKLSLLCPLPFFKKY